MLLNESVKIIIRNEYRHDDFISLELLYDNLLKKNQGKISNKEIEEYFNVKLKEIDTTVQISYEYFLKKVLSEELILNQTNVNKIFNIIDADKD